MGRGGGLVDFHAIPDDATGAARELGRRNGEAGMETIVWTDEA